MNEHLQNIISNITQSAHLSEEEKAELIKEAKAADKALTISEFKLERAEKVKHTTSVLLEETIEELENKRKAVEAQNRELEIEAALERVRSRTMGMQKSDELREVIQLIYEQFMHLGIDVFGAGFMMDYKERDDWYQWAADFTNSFPTLLHIPYFDHPYWNAWNDAKRKGLDAFIYTMALEEKNSYVLGLNKHIPDLSAESIELVLSTPGYSVSNVFLQHVALYVDRFTTEPFSDADNAILMRFGKVFEQTYTRFKDLEKAEAQARESQIQLALERVRARTMAMYKSDELAEVVYILFQQFRELGENPDQATIGIINEAEWVIEYWVTMYGNQMNRVFKFSIDEPHVTNKIYKAWKDGKKSLVIDLGGIELREFMEYRASKGGAAVKEHETRRIINVAFFSKGLINVQSLEARSAESIMLLERFAGVLDLTYTRFLDLQKAEAQAREAEIQLALERLRARTMAMHQSSELAEAASVMFDQLSLLGASLWICGFNICHEDSEIVESWMSPPTGKIMDPMFIPYTIDEFSTYAYKSWKDHRQMYTDIMEGIALQESHEELLKQPPMHAARNHIIENNIEMPTWVQRFAIPYKFGYLMIVTTKFFEETDILIRFASVFEQTYTRFLDLKNSETRAREALIEASLERVRATTNAMHESIHLGNVIKVVTEQLLLLGLRFDVANFVKMQPNGDKEFWVSTPGQSYPGKVFLPYLDHPIFNELKELSRTDQSFFANVFGKEEKNLFFNHFFNHLGAIDIPRERKQYVLDSKGFARSVFRIRDIYFSVGNYNATPYSDEENGLLNRFAKVFEQAYTRFVDLQKAEAQAREAQIEAALEKVRSRSLAMHKSDELWEVIAEVFKKLQELNFSIDGAAFILTFTTGSKEADLWLADDHGQLYPSSLKLPYYNTPVINDFWQAKESGLDFFSKTYSFEEKNHWLNYAFEHTDIRILSNELKNWILAQPCLTQPFALGKHSLIGIHFHHERILSENEIDILKRFSKVFDQAYIRFLDLQKTEAQAREAHIQLALERVRARTMAMYKSEDLSELSLELVKQVQSLGVATWFCAFNIYDDDPAGSIEWGSNGQGVFPKYRTPKEGVFLRYYEAGQRGETLLINEISEEQCPAHYEYLCSLPGVGDQLLKMKEAGIPFPVSQIDHVAFFKYGYIIFITYEPVPETHDIFKRFAKVFEQSFTRFLDLQKAETQAREAQIEAALERVRSRSMGMQKSEELKEVIQVVYEQFVHLNIHTEHTGFILDYKARDDYYSWIADQFGTPSQVTLPYFDCIYYNRFNEAKKEGIEFFAITLNREEKNRFYEDLFKHIPGFPEESKKIIFSHPGFTISTVLLDNVALYIENFTGITYSDDENAILMRFGKVFQQTYTRFLDLQKAEAQAREASIEAALERVRSRTMGMQKSTELNEVAFVLFEQIRMLGGKLWGTGFALCNTQGGMDDFWFANELGIMPPVSIPNTEDEVHVSMLQGWKDHKDYMAFQKGGEALAAHYQYLYSLPQMKAFFDPMLEVGFQFPEWQQWHAAYFSKGYLLIITTEPYTESDIFKRFAKVFDQTYTRFLDLQKAEAQAREARIEAALERVRSRSIAMRKSEEIAEIAAKIFSELKQLDLVLNRVLIWTFNDIKKITTWWSANPEIENTADSYRIDYNENPVFINFLQAWQQRKPIHLFTLSGETKMKWEDYLFEHTELSRLPLEVKKGMRSEATLYTISVISDYGLMMSGSLEPLSHASIDIIQRFGRVFQQSYTRYLDVQKAEAQAREAQIEAALEKVRANAMAMHHSEQLEKVVVCLFDRFIELGLTFNGAGIYLFNKEKRNMHLWIASQVADPVKVNLPHDADIANNHINQELWNLTEKGEDVMNRIYSGPAKDDYYRYVSKYNEFTIPESVRIMMIEAEQWIASFAVEKHCALLIDSWTGHLTSNTDFQIVKRFARVFEQAYVRFLDLQKAEAQARDAIKHSSVDRVRAEIASMRTTEDLQRITPLIWRELTTLGVPFFRCGIFIMNEEEQKAHIYLSTPDGKPLAALHLAFESSVTTLNAADNWRLQKVYKEHWNREQFLAWVQSLIGQGQLVTPLSYQGGDEPPESLTLQFIPFKQGMLYIGSADALTDEQVELAQELAHAFSVAYARYDDFKKLEDAKSQVEKALNELKGTQKQLIQSEKMASLGELTAGIAHEIQNPLNFVNNFSDINIELIAEMKDEIEKGNIDEVKAIADDMEENEQKINHHGRRADAIVKGMLQHSRSSTGQKEPADINKIADEYLRLSYHGLRAKDKQFNADIQTEFDEAIGKINIVPQDIGRVLLNLFNNAFYAVNEKQKAESSKPKADVNKYEPKVTVSTKKADGKIIISVKDNGNGIQEKIKEKIFQPFFTTKPTGSGTGLGLSLSYDIVKVHGGEIKVETKEGQGTTFIIQLPVS